MTSEANDCVCWNDYRSNLTFGRRLAVAFLVRRLVILTLAGFLRSKILIGLGSTVIVGFVVVVNSYGTRVVGSSVTGSGTFVRSSYAFSGYGISNYSMTTDS